MSQEITKKTVMAVLDEVVEGTPVAPSAGTDFLALQDGFSPIEPAIDSLTNAELQSGIGASKPVLGLENPTTDSDHYIRHSGVEGTAPNYGKYLKGLLGAETVNSTEYNTIAGAVAGDSTTRGKVVVDSAEGLFYQRGEALMIKDGASSYSVRNVHSISTDDLNLNYNIAAAPGVGVDLGKAVIYEVQNDSHPSFSMWQYLGNGGAIALMSGSKVTDGTIAATAGDYINGSFTFAGQEYYWNPLTIVAGNKYIDITDDVGVILVTLDEQTFKDPHELASHIAAKATAASVGSGDDAIDCTYIDATGEYKFDSDGGVAFSILWKTGVHGLDNADDSVASLIGFSTAADDTGAFTYTGDTAIDLSAPYTPSFDSEDPLVAKNGELFVGDFADNVCLNHPNSFSLAVTNTASPVEDMCEESGRGVSVFTAREITLDLSFKLDRYDADKYFRFRTGQETEFMMNFGRKSGGNWIPGSVFNVWLPTAVISDYSTPDNDGMVDVNLVLTAYMDNGASELYINFL